jgi:hypothetical protein
MCDIRKANARRWCGGLVQTVAEAGRRRKPLTINRNFFQRLRRILAGRWKNGPQAGGLHLQNTENPAALEQPLMRYEWSGRTHLRACSPSVRRSGASTDHHSAVGRRTAQPHGGPPARHPLHQHSVARTPDTIGAGRALYSRMHIRHWRNVPLAPIFRSS